MAGVKNIFITDYQIAEPDSPGDFGYKRYGYFHEGIDIYCKDKTPIHAYEDGIVINICHFTGKYATPVTEWWNDTQSILIEGKSGVIGYCEILPCDSIKIGHKIKVGQLLGIVIPVLKEDKGWGKTMLHIELYAHGTTDHADWRDHMNQPEELMNPRVLFENK